MATRSRNRQRVTCRLWCVIDSMIGVVPVPSSVSGLRPSSSRYSTILSLPCHVAVQRRRPNRVEVEAVPPAERGRLRLSSRTSVVNFDFLSSTQTDTEHLTASGRSGTQATNPIETQHAWILQAQPFHLFYIATVPSIKSRLLDGGLARNCVLVGLELHR